MNQSNEYNGFNKGMSTYIFTTVQEYIYIYKQKGHKQHNKTSMNEKVCEI